MNKPADAMQLLEKHFDSAFAAPDGIKKLRELILTLAMQGKLVPQNANDQPAKELLKEIEAEKKRRVKRGVFSDKDNQESFDEKGVPFQLPIKWQWCTIQDIGFVLGGKRLPKGHSYSDTPTVYRYITVTNMKNNTIVDNDIKYIRPETYDEIKKYVISKEDIYITIAGTIGAVGSIPESNDGMNLTENAAKLVFFKCNKIFLIYLLNSQVVQNQFVSLTNKMAQPKLSLRSILSTLIPLPPLDEQQRIVAKIDQLMARCDELEKLRVEWGQKRIAVHSAVLNRLLTATEGETFSAAWAFITQNFRELYSVKENVTELRKAILQLAVMGKLVPQNSNDQPASELLKEIEAEKKRLVKEGKIKAPKPLPEIKPAEVPYELPQGWVWVRMGEVGDTNIGLTYTPSDISDTGTPVLRSNNVQEGKLDLTDLKRVSAKIKETVLVKEGDLLICARNGSKALVGKTALVTGLSEEMAFGAFMAIFRSRVNEYLLHFINSPLFRKMIDEVNTMTINQITQGNLRSTIFPLPPFAEQRRIVAKIDQLMALCDELEKQIDATTGKQTALLNAIMAQV